MSRSLYKNLVIIGNGFDMWQGLPTSYECFRRYYHANVERIAKELNCTFYGADNKSKYTAVELIYGDPLNPEHLEDSFFWNLEARMDKLDDQLINIYFGRSEEGIKKLANAVEEAIMLLRRVFCDWVNSIDVEAKLSGYVFPEDTFIINFNYTNTLRRRFYVIKKNDFHIHGEADEPDSIIVGHTSHPEEPFKELKERHFMVPENPEKGLPRVDGLYAIEEALYKTDKHIYDNIDRLCAAMLKASAHIEDFENIYVLGHSFADADLEYFRFVSEATKCGCNYESLSAYGHLDIAFLDSIVNDGEIGLNRLFASIILNAQYAMQRRERIFPDKKDLFAHLDEGREDKKLPYPETLAKETVSQRFWFEQVGRTDDFLKNLAKQYGVSLPEGCHSVLDFADYIDGWHDPRKRNPIWHVSYHSEEDKKRIKKALKTIGIKEKNYELLGSIDECIKAFKWMK